MHLKTLSVKRPAYTGLSEMYSILSDEICAFINLLVCLFLLDLLQENPQQACETR